MFLSRRASLRWRRVWIVGVLKHEAAVSQMFVMVLVLDSNLIANFILSVLTRSQICSSERRQTSAHRVCDQMITHEEELWSRLCEEPIREDSAELELSHTLRGSHDTWCRSTYTLQ